MKIAEIKTIREKNTFVTEPFEERLDVLFEELYKAEHNVSFAKRLEELEEDGHCAFIEAPVFMEWLLEAKWRETIISLSKVFETRKRAKDLKSLVRLIDFIEKHDADVFYREFYLEKDEGKKKLEPASFEEIINDYERLHEEYAGLIQSILKLRDKDLAHLTTSNVEVSLDRSALSALISDTLCLLGEIAHKYDPVRELPRPESDADFFTLLAKYKGVMMKERLQKQKRT